MFHLPDKVRNVAILYYLELWSIKEIHGELGLAIGTIKTQLRQTRELLRKEFGVERIGEGIMSAKREGSKHTETRIKVIGVGGAGGNAVKRMIEADLTDIEFYAVNTDQQALDKHDEATPVQIGANTTQGLGSGANPEIGKRAAEEDRETLDTMVADADIVFVIAGMGGGTGAGACAFHRISCTAHRVPSPSGLSLGHLGLKGNAALNKQKLGYRNFKKMRIPFWSCRTNGCLIGSNSS